MNKTTDGIWTTASFAAFARGTCGNAGHNLYISHQGVLQRIHQHDLTGDGNLDLVFCNSQSHWEKPPTYAYRNPLGESTRLELPSDAARTGAVADLNGDGYDDLVLGMWHDGIRADLNARIYYGSPDGWSERAQQQLPAPLCSCVASGDFDNDGRPDLAFLTGGKVRLFYQTDLGFESKQFVDLGIDGDQLAAADLDSDGLCDLIVRADTGRVAVYWNSPDGFHPDRFTPVPVDPDPPIPRSPEARFAEYVPDAMPLVQVLLLQGIPHIFVARREAAYLVPVADRHFGPPLVFHVQNSMSASLGDIDGDGHPDLALACRHPHADGECSWIYWGSADGFGADLRTPAPSQNACDVAVADLDDDGCADIALCQCRSEASYTTESLLYRGTPDRVLADPIHLVSEDARRVFLARPSADRQYQTVLPGHFARNALGDIPVTVYCSGPGGFSPKRRQDLPGWGAIEALCCDIDDDGCPDLILANASENSVHRDPGSYVLRNTPGGFEPEPRWKLPTARAHGVCCADLDRDGYLDLIFCGFFNPEILVFHGTADGFDTENPDRIRIEHAGVTYDEPRWIYLADLDGDGWLDLVIPLIAHDRSFVLWGGPEGFSMDRCQPLSVFHAACARAADLTGNGYLDLVLGGHTPSLDAPHDTFLTIYWNGPEGLREDHRTLLPAYGINAMAIADFDSDGQLDIFACSYHDGRRRDIDSYIYWNRPGRGFSEKDFTRLFTHSASGCVADDFDEDGRVDLAIAYHKVWGDHQGHSAIWHNSPEGFSENRVTRLPTSGPHGMTAVGPGNIVDRGPEEYYTSAPFELPRDARVEKIIWDADIPPKSWVRAQLRCATTEDNLESAEWFGSGGLGSWYENGQAVSHLRHTDRWIQYRLALGALHGGSSPRVRRVAVRYS